MIKQIAKLNNVLNMMKDFDAGYTTANKNEMLIKSEGKVFKLTLQEVDETELTSDAIDRQL